MQLCDLLLRKLPFFISSGHIEVQERASSAFMLIQMLRQEFGDAVNTVETTNDILSGIETNMETEIESVVHISIVAIEIVQEMTLLFMGDLNPVAPKAQRKVQIPDGLDLDEWINVPPEDSSSSSEEEQTDLFVSHARGGGGDGDIGRRHKVVELTAEELDKVNIYLYFLIININFIFFV